MQIPTNPMYDIDENAVVRLISTGEIVHEVINRYGKRAVTIRGKSHKPSSHPLDRLILNTFKPLPLGKDPEWMSVGFLDGNKNNVSIENLEWKDSWYHPKIDPGVNISLDSWVRVYGYPQIDIRISHLGVMLRNALTHNEIGVNKDANNYASVKIPMADKRIGVHRLVALTFLAHPIDTDHLTVNHKDSNPLNNLPYNLEWATYTQNNFHSFSQGPRGETIRKIVIRNMGTGEEVVASGYNEAAKILDVAPGSVHSVMERRTTEGRPYRGHLLKYADDPRSWEELSRSSHVSKGHPLGKIARKDMVTGEVVIYGSFLEALKGEGFNNVSTLVRLIGASEIIPWRRKCFQLIQNDKTLVWPDYPSEILDVFTRVHATDKPIEICNPDGSVSYRANVTEWCMEDRDNRCDPAVLSRVLKKTNRWRDWVFSDIDLNRYLPVEVKS